MTSHDSIETERRRLQRKKWRGTITKEEAAKLRAMPAAAPGRKPVVNAAPFVTPPTPAPTAPPSSTPTPAPQPTAGDPGDLPPVDFGPEDKPKDPPPAPKVEKVAVAKMIATTYVSILKNASDFVLQSGGLAIPPTGPVDIYGTIFAATERLALRYLPDDTNLEVADEVVVAAPAILIFGQAAYFHTQNRKAPKPAAAPPTAAGNPPNGQAHEPIEVTERPIPRSEQEGRVYPNTLAAIVGPQVKG